MSNSVADAPYALGFSSASNMDAFLANPQQTHCSFDLLMNGVGVATNFSASAWFFFPDQRSCNAAEDTMLQLNGCDTTGNFCTDPHPYLEVNTQTCCCRINAINTLPLLSSVRLHMKRLDQDR